MPRRHAARRRENGRFGRILRYHRVIPPGETPGYYRLGIPVALFEAQMRWLSAHHHVVSLEKFLGLARSGSRPREDVVVITFDEAPVLSISYGCGLEGGRSLVGEFGWADAIE